MQYFRPNTIKDYFATVEDVGRQNFKLFAGGTDLIPRCERGQILPDAIIDLKKLPDFTGIKKVEDNIEIGAGTTIEEIKNSNLIKKYYFALWQATTEFGSVQIRNRATIGGNICNASPAGDTLPALYAFGAKLVLRKNNSDRTIPIDDFILGPGKTTIEKEELLQTVILPLSSSISIFYKLGLREAMAISVVNFAIVYGKNELKIALGAVAPTIIKLTGLDKYSIDQVLEKVNNAISPIDDIRTTALYRRKALQNMLKFELSKIVKNNVG
ncbi:MAG: xanthine dehydrogenase family protein subunit M [Planctomycetia bacterium]|nr:xanthine dehydrogenase family protein subunit M [Planctomycetia bacterium]